MFDGVRLAGDSHKRPLSAILRAASAIEGSAVEFRILGAIEAVGPEGRSAPLGGELQRALLASLLLDHGRAVSRQRLVESLWHDPPRSAAHAIEVYVSKLRRSLASIGATSAITTLGAGYALQGDDAQVDLARFRHLARSGRDAAAAGAPEIAWQTMTDALALWRGEPLACLDTCPLVATRRELEEERLRLVEARVEVGLELGRHDELLPELRTLTREHVERERLWAALMLALYRSGRQTEALAAFTSARTHLDEELGIEPGPELRELQRQILAHDPTIAPVDVVHRHMVDALPSPPSSFVGRASELAAAAELLERPDVRLLTVLGSGGVGKSRFALELARAASPRFADGVRWITLDAVDEAAQVPARIASVLGLPPSDDPRAGLARMLSGQQLLLVLDTFEHVADAATDVHRLLEHAAGLHVVVTSRTPLHLSAEHRFELPPLIRADAAELFVARARAVDPSAAPPSEVVDEICERLDRIPLALELAAPRAGRHSGEALLAELSSALDFDSRRDPPRRHRTLRATLEWSYALLGHDEQTLLRRLSVFAGGFTPDAAAAVGGHDASLESLLDKSLVHRSTADAQSRFRLLDTVRDFAALLLDAEQETEFANDAHAAWFVELARSIAHDGYGCESESELELFLAEAANFERALDFLVGTGDDARALVLVRSLASYWYYRSTPLRNLQRADAVLSLAGGDDRDRGRCLYYGAASSMECGQIAASHVMLEDAEQRFAVTDDLAGLSMVENLRCYLAFAAGEAEKGLPHGDRALDLARRAGSAELDWNAASNLGVAYVGLISDGLADRAMVERCRELLENAALQADRLDPASGLVATGNLVDVLVELGELERAFELVRELLAPAREFEGSLFSVLPMLTTFASLASKLCEHARAVELLAGAEREAELVSWVMPPYIVRRNAEVETAARAALGDTAVDRLRANSTRLSVHEIVTAALALRVDQTSAIT